MFSTGRCETFEPVVFTIGSEDEEDSEEDTCSEGDTCSNVSNTKTAEKVYLTAATPEKSIEEMHDIIQPYYAKLMAEKEKLLARVNEKQQRLSELQKRKQTLEQERDQIQSTVRLIERRVFLLSKENVKRTKSASKYQKYKKVLENIIQHVKAQNQSMKTKFSSHLAQFLFKIKVH